MKKTIKLFIVLIFFVKISNAQNLGVIELNVNKAATLEFSSNIDANFPLIGNNIVEQMGAGNQPIFKYYDIWTVDNLSIIRAKQEKIPESSITVRLENGKIYTGTIKYVMNPEKSHYVYKLPGESKNENTNYEESQNSNELEEIDKELVRERLKMILETENRIDNLAEIKDKIIFKVGNIMYDEQYTYFKILIANRSSSTYQINGVMTKYEEGKKGIFNRKEIVNSEWIRAYDDIYPDGNIVKANSVGKIGCVIPIYNTANGELIIKIIEKNGTRDVDIIVKSDALARAKTF
jgi:hypothetical protein